jgi:ribosomal protein S6--L-glutamate ligase
MLLLALASIPIPETFIFREESFIANNAYLHEKLTYPAVFKTDGSQGRNVRFIERYEDVLPHLDAKRPAKLALVQPFIENTFDTRTIVAYGRVLGTISRTRTSGYLNNIAQGAVPARYELTAQEKDLAIRATHACRIDIGGVDMVHTKNGPLILEVNKSPQVAGFEAVHDFRVFTRIAQMLRDNASQNTSSTAPSVTTSRTDSSTA